MVPPRVNRTLRDFLVISLNSQKKIKIKINLKNLSKFWWVPKLQMVSWENQQKLAKGENSYQSQLSQISVCSTRQKEEIKYLLYPYWGYHLSSRCCSILPVCRAEIETQMQRNKRMDTKGGKWQGLGGGGGGMSWEIGIDIYTLICIQQITNKNLLYKK